MNGSVHRALAAIVKTLSLVAVDVPPYFHEVIQSDPDQVFYRALLQSYVDGISKQWLFEVNR